MKYKPIAVTLLCLLLIAFLSSGYYGAGKLKQSVNEVSRLNQVIQQKDAEINTLAGQLQAKQQELESMKKEFDSAKQELDNVLNNLTTVTDKPAVPQQ